MTTRKIDDAVMEGAFSKSVLLFMVRERDSDFTNVDMLSTNDGLIALADLAGAHFCRGDHEHCRQVLAAIVSNKLVSKKKLVEQSEFSAHELDRILDGSHEGKPEYLRTVMTALRIIGRPAAAA